VLARIRRRTASPERALALSRGQFSFRTNRDNFFARIGWSVWRKWDERLRLRE
jgi:hypothetical protein